MGILTTELPGNGKLNVLNAGFVEYLDHMGTDEDVIRAARTSTGKGFLGWEPGNVCSVCKTPQGGMHEYVETTPYAGCGMCRIGPGALVHNLACGDSPTFKHVWEPHKGDAGLLKYLYVNRHMTPLEMCELKLLVKAPIIYFRQLHRHRAANYNEMSGRYMQLPNEFYVPRPEDVKAQSKTNKQGSEGALSERVAGAFIDEVKREQWDAYGAYEDSIKDGIAPEMARINLPVSIYSVCVVKVNLRMALHMLGLRDDSHAQGLTQEVSRAIAEFVKALWPRTYALYEEYTKHALTLSRTERALLRGMLGSMTGPTDNNPQWSAEAEALYQKLTKVE